jgi:L-ribulose-5-phosphate 3-epimerase
MEHAIGTTFNFNIPIEEMVPLVVQAGFRRISLAGGNASQSGYLDAGVQKKTQRVCSQYDVRVDSIHAPFGSQLDISSPDPGIRRAGVELILRAIDTCAFFDCSQLMLHLNDRFDWAELETRLTVIEKSVAIIIEYADHVLSLYTAHRIGMCLDTSHAHLSHTLYDIMDQYCMRMSAVHISDNRGEHDDHMLPYEGTIDWNRFARDFARTGYTGTFLLEVEMRESAFHEPLEFLHEAYCRSKKLQRMIAEYRNTC